MVQYIYNSNIKNPFVFPILFFFGRKAKSKSKTENAITHGISLDKISEATWIGFNIAVNPSTDPILKILDPIIFPTDNPFSFFIIAKRKR